MARVSGQEKSEVQKLVDEGLAIGEAIENPEEEIPKLYEKFGYTSDDIDNVKRKAAPLLDNPIAKGVMKMFGASEETINDGIDGIKRRTSKTTRASAPVRNGSNGGPNREQRRASAKTSNKPDFSKYK